MLFDRVCVFGDSIAWGSWDYERGGWVERLKTEYLRRGLHGFGYRSILNCGIGGERVADVVRRLPYEMTARGGEIVILACGINDSPHYDQLGTNQEAFSSDFASLIELAQQRVNNVLVLEPTNVIDGPDGGFTNEAIAPYARIINEQCGKRNVPLLPLFGLLHENHLTNDRLHPSPEGHELIYHKVLQWLDDSGW